MAHAYGTLNTPCGPFPVLCAHSLSVLQTHQEGRTVSVWKLCTKQDEDEFVVIESLPTSKQSLSLPILTLEYDGKQYLCFNFHQYLLHCDENCAQAVVKRLASGRYHCPFLVEERTGESWSKRPWKSLNDIISYYLCSRGRSAQNVDKELFTTSFLAKHRHKYGSEILFSSEHDFTDGVARPFVSLDLAQRAKTEIAYLYPRATDYPALDMATLAKLRDCITVSIHPNVGSSSQHHKCIHIKDVVDLYKLLAPPHALLKPWHEQLVTYFSQMGFHHTGESCHLPSQIDYQKACLNERTETRLKGSFDDMSKPVSSTPDLLDNYDDTFDGSSSDASGILPPWAGTEESESEPEVED